MFLEELVVKSLYEFINLMEGARLDILEKIIKNILEKTSRNPAERRIELKKLQSTLSNSIFYVLILELVI